MNTQFPFTTSLRKFSQLYKLIFKKKQLKILHHAKELRAEKYKMLDEAATYTDGVDVGLVAGEGLPAHSFSNIPQFGRGIAGTRNKTPGIGGKGQTHHISSVPSKCGCLLTSFYVPESTGKNN